jgi:hypothetical protein
MTDDLITAGPQPAGAEAQPGPGSQDEAEPMSGPRTGDRNRKPPAAGLDRRRQLLTLALAGLWLVDACLQMQPYMWGQAFYGSMLQMANMDLPGWMTQLEVHLSTWVVPHTVAWNALFIATQASIGLGLLWRRTRRAFLALSVLWGLVVWLAGEGLGGITMPGSSPLNGAPGPALLYVVVALMLWPGRRCGPTRAGRSVADDGVGGRLGARLAWVALWIGTGVLWLRPINFTAPGPGGALANAGDAGPGWERAINHAVGSLVGNSGIAFALVMSSLQVLTAAGVLNARTRRPALILGATLAAFYGLFGQDLGGLATGQATDPGTLPILLLWVAALWPLAHDAGVAERVAPRLGPHGEAVRGVRHRDLG